MHSQSRRPFLLVTLLVGSGALAQSREEGRRQLREELQGLVAPLASKARVSLQVESLDDGSVLFSQGGETTLNIASNTKLFSTAAALATLGPDYVFTTELYVDQLKAGRASTLFVRGKGDPTLTTERLYGIAAALLHQGLREVSGDLVLDESWFDAQRTPAGYDQEDTDFAYMAPTGALSLHANAVGLYVLPARPGVRPQLAVDPASDYVVVDSSRLTTQCPRPDLRVKSIPDGERQKLIVSGCLVDPRSGARVWKKIDQPAFYFGHTFKRVLAERGIQVKGKVRLGASPTQTTPFYVAESEPLAEVLKKINKRSINFSAETLLKTMAAEKVGTPGTFQAGLEVTARFLEKEVGLARGSYRMDNGSGLNDANRFSAAQVNRLLRYMQSRLELAPDYLASLGIAGVDGTLRNRFGKTDAERNLRGKTGTLANVTAVSGYLRAAGGEHFTFSFIANDFPGRAGEVRKSLDALGAAVAHLGKRPLELEPPSPSPEALALAAAKRKVESLTALHAQPAFLLTAFSTESDPAVRLVLADALLRADARDERHRRALFSSLEMDARQVVYVQSVFRSLRRRLPAIDHAVSLACAGDFEATARLVQLAPAAEGAADDELAPALERVATYAPKTLLYVLRSSKALEQLSASRLLVRKLATGRLSGLLPKKSVTAPEAAFTSVSELLEGEEAPAVTAPGTAPSALPAAGSTAARTAPLGG